MIGAVLVWALSVAAVDPTQATNELMRTDDDVGRIGAAAGVGGVVAFNVVGAGLYAGLICSQHCPEGVATAVNERLLDSMNFLLLAPSAAAVVVGPVAAVIAGIVVGDIAAGLAVAGITVVYSAVAVVAVAVIAGVFTVIALTGFGLATQGYSQQSSIVGGLMLCGGGLLAVVAGLGGILVVIGAAEVAAILPGVLAGNTLRALRSDVE